MGDLSSAVLYAPMNEGRMQINFPLIRRNVLRAIAGRPKGLEALAEREWALCNEESVIAKPAVFLDGALEKVEGLSPWRTWEIELPMVRGGVVCHAASKAQLIRNVDLAGPFLYQGAAKMRIGYGPERLFTRDFGDIDLLDKANLVTSWAGSHFFGPFLKCDIPLEMIEEGSPQNISMVTKPYEHAADYRELFGLPEVPLKRRARIRELVLYTDFAQNSFKVKRYRDLRTRIRKAIPSPTGSKGVYLKRGQTGELRVLDNEDDIIAFLSGIGFEIVEPGRLTAAEIAAKTLDTPVVVSVEGSHLSHAIFTLREQGTLLVIQPPDRFATPFKEITDGLDMSFAFLVGERTDNGFSVPLDDLRRMLDRITL